MRGLNLFFLLCLFVHPKGLAEYKKWCSSENRKPEAFERVNRYNSAFAMGSCTYCWEIGRWWWVVPLYNYCYCYLINFRGLNQSWVIYSLIIHDQIVDGNSWGCRGEKPWGLYVVTGNSRRVFPAIQLIGVRYWNIFLIKLHTILIRIPYVLML